MALTNNDIQTVKNYLDTVRTGMENILESNNTFKYVMDNPSFREFADGTGLGTDVQLKLDGLSATIDGSFNDSVNKLIIETNEVLENQYQVNNRSVN